MIAKAPAIDPSKSRLVITRRHMESVQIGDDITVTVLESHSSKAVKLAIVAPREMRILRTELEPIE